MFRLEYLYWVLVLCIGLICFERYIFRFWLLYCLYGLLGLVVKRLRLEGRCGSFVVWLVRLSRLIFLLLFSLKLRCCWMGLVFFNWFFSFRFVSSVVVKIFEMELILKMFWWLLINVNLFGFCCILIKLIFLFLMIVMESWVLFGKFLVCLWISFVCLWVIWSEL